MKGIRVPFNPLNKRKGMNPCCCEKRYYTKFAASTIFCIVCNIICARRLTGTESFCKKNGWDKTCRTCRQQGDYHLHDKI